MKYRHHLYLGDTFGMVVAEPGKVGEMSIF